MFNRAWQEIANIEKEKRNLEIEKLKLEKQKLNMEKNKLECLPAQSNKSVHYLSIEKLKRNYQG
jgi:hypothetical protein